MKRHKSQRQEANLELLVAWMRFFIRLWDVTFLQPTVPDIISIFRFSIESSVREACGPLAWLAQEFHFYLL